MNRLLIAITAFFNSLLNPETAQRVALALNPPPPPPPEPPKPPTFDLRVLALLQRDGRLIDFLMEQIDGFDDAQIGSAVRDIHAKCRKTMLDHFTIEPIGGAEGTSLQVHVGYDPATTRLLGQVSGSGPWKGSVTHGGWQATSVKIPEIPGAFGEVPVLHPVEVEV
ncbi:MAG: DUF2760 domain-containing protein [bacterium]